MPFKYPTMMTFGGADLKTVFVTSGRWAIADKDAADHPLTMYAASKKAATEASSFTSTVRPLAPRPSFSAAASMRGVWLEPPDQA